MLISHLTKNIIYHVLCIEKSYNDLLRNTGYLLRESQEARNYNELIKCRVFIIVC